MSWVGVSAIIGFLGVAFGAFGAHGLRGHVSPDLYGAYETGVLYHLIHAVALFALTLYGRATKINVTLPASVWLAGIVLFSGSLYALALSGVSHFGWITPLGGLCLLAGWVLAAVKLW
jgi:uncharacterized membrane protein YgdD (TMEM256/DUF423 family)